MPIDPSAVAITFASVHIVMTSASAAISFYPSYRWRSAYRLFDSHGVGYGMEHLRDAGIVRAGTVDVLVDGLEPSLQVGEGQGGGGRRVDHQVHLGRGADSAQGHEVPEASDRAAAEAAIEVEAARPHRAVARSFAVRVDLEQDGQRRALRRERLRDGL